MINHLTGSELRHNDQVFRTTSRIAPHMPSWSVNLLAEDVTGLLEEARQADAPLKDRLAIY
jgi:hypothetical protein